jgi:hypothetical protein
MVRKGAIRLRAFSFGDFELVSQTHGGDAKEFIVTFDAAFNFRL